uniref:Zinc finger protein 507 n=2 Tax=Astyanax mexicanus TaxID=7994 RepID=A0A8B9LUH1_ASTMX
MEDSSDVVVLVPHPRDQQDSDQHQKHQNQQQQQQAADSLIQVIEKLSKIVEKRPRRCALPGKKRPSMTCASLITVPDSREGGGGGASPCKIFREHAEEVLTAGEPGTGTAPRTTVTCYQCSLCRFLSPTLTVLKEHLKQHDEQHSDLILMCSECRFTSSHQEELEAHVKLHLLQRGGAGSRGSVQGRTGFSGSKPETECGKTPASSSSTSSSSSSAAAPKKWYSYDNGKYRCLICSYECRQQRNLKTHAWKHAGLVDCSYPIFEEEADQREVSPVLTLSTSPPLSLGKEDESIVVFTPAEDKTSQAHCLHSGPSVQMELCSLDAVKCDGIVTAATEAATAAAEKEEEEEEESAKGLEGPIIENVFSLKAPLQEEPIVEVQVTPEAQMELELELETENQQASTDSLLSSAQKIISCSGNGAGHVNVIVERLPCAEEPVASRPLLLSPEVAGDKTLLASKDDVDLDDQPLQSHYEEPEEVVIGWNGGNENSEHLEETSDKEESVVLPPDENVPPARRRTHSECLRLHSLAAEALVAMPMRAPELGKSVVKGMAGSCQIPDASQRILELSTASASPGTISSPSSLLNIGLTGVPQGSKEEVLAEGPSKAGISMSLLTVIERLRERSDQNASDEDILKELQDNAQSQHGAGVAGMVVGSGDASVAESGLVEYIAGSERPYRCRLCLYSSGNKGYIKQHLRVHRQRQPYQCPICEHVACDSKDLESHMIHHCKTRMYSCKQCGDTFHYKSQLRNHEREQHGLGDASPTLTAACQTTATTDQPDKISDEAEKIITDEDSVSDQKVYKCDVCDYTSSTYVGVRNHRRIHNSDKPYRCCNCNFATTNMNSLKSHMKKHPQEHQAVHLLEQYRCSLCGYMCSHPPSLKSHMWKHAGDQNYNYEQVNKAINEAMSQSSRSPVVPAKVGAGSREKSAPGVTCMLLFCCCICGFESTIKENLMEHMKEHEGDIISIILSKEQQGGEPAEPSAVQ